jgi:hypothetical protein
MRQRLFGPLTSGGTGQQRTPRPAEYGSPVSPGRQLSASYTGAWWLTQSPEKAAVLVLGIKQPLFIAWDLDHGVMTVHRWSPRALQRSDLSLALD